MKRRRRRNPSSDNTMEIVLLVGGVGLALWYLSTQSPTAQAAAAQTAALQSQQIAANATQGYVTSGSNLIENLVGDFTS
jgi:hypothetical protein